MESLVGGECILAVLRACMGLLVSGSSALMYGELCVSQYGGLGFGASGCNCWAGSEAGPGMLAYGGSIWARRVLWSEGRHPSRLQSPFPAALQVLSLPLPACIFSSACIVSAVGTACLAAPPCLLRFVSSSCLVFFAVLVILLALSRAQCHLLGSGLLGFSVRIPVCCVIVRVP
jgi:hypothetical protein